MTDTNVLRSPAVGTSTTDLVEPCDAPRPPRSTPRSPDGRAPLVVTLSGGGFRATLGGLGVLRFLADAGLLTDVRYVSSVSGGSVANGLLAVAMPALRAGGFDRGTFDRELLVPFVDRMSKESLSGRMLRRVVTIIGPKTRTDLLADQLDELYFHGLRLQQLDPDWRFVFNAANTSTGVRFGFEREVLGDYVLGELPTAPYDVRLAVAVAASAAVPGLLAPTAVRGLPAFPCQGNRRQRLVDGGVYDNMGLEAVDDIPGTFLVALNAGGLFVTGRTGGRIPLVRDLLLAQSLLYRQSTALRRRAMVERFRAFEAVEDPHTGLVQTVPEWARHGVLFGLSTTMPDDPRTKVWRDANPDEPGPGVARVKTTFDRFEQSLCRDLVHAGWWLAGATISTFHPHLLADPTNPPLWSEPW